ncbi:MAG: FAD-dependent oxidoreductase, partial [Microbacteriaceae bacterium]
LAYAALVGAILATPFAFSGPEIGPLTLGLFSTPEFALVVGNVLAFVAGQRRALRFDFVSRRQLTPTSWEFELRPHGPVRFAPGQYVELTVPHRKADSRGIRRTFSIASAPHSTDAVKLGLRVPPGRFSTFKHAMLELEPGSRLHGTAVGGDFLLPKDTDAPLLLVAGGIGITPFISQLGAARRSDAVLAYAVSSTDEIAYAVEIAASGCRVLLVSPEPLTRMPENWEWIGPDRLTGEALLAAVPDAASRRTYLSGPPSLIAELRPALRRAGVRRPRTDAFIGY